MSNSQLFLIKLSPDIHHQDRTISHPAIKGFLIPLVFTLHAWRWIPVWTISIHRLCKQDLVRWDGCLCESQRPLPTDEKKLPRIFNTLVSHYMLHPDTMTTCTYTGKSCKYATLVWMACCRHYLSQCWPRSLSPYGVTMPQPSIHITQ